MNTDQPQNEEQTAHYVERQMQSLADPMRDACAMLDRLPAATLRDLLATVDAALVKQPAWENVAGHALLSPEYFALASEVHELREQLARSLAVAEANESTDPGAAALGELADAHGMIAASKAALQAVRRRKLPKRDARIVYDQCGLGIQLARSLAKLPECAPWQEAFEQVAVTMDSLREEARRLMPSTPTNGN